MGTAKVIWKGGRGVEGVMLLGRSRRRGRWFEGLGYVEGGGLWLSKRSIEERLLVLEMWWWRRNADETLAVAVNRRGRGRRKEERMLIS